MDNAKEGEEIVPQAPRGLKTTVYVMGVLLVVGFIAVFSTIIYRAANMGNNPATATRGAGAEPWSIEATLPAGAQILEMSQADHRLTVRYGSHDSQAIMVFDLKTGQQLGRINFTQ